MREWLAILLLGAGVPAQPPKTKVEPLKEVIHGVTITDPYRWLEDQNSPETRAWIDAQVQYTDTILKGLPVRDRIRSRLSALLTTERVNIPFERGGRYFYSKRAPGQSQFVTYLRKGLNGTDEVLMDPNPLSADHTISGGVSDVSRDGSIAAIYLRSGGEDETTWSFIDVNTRKPLLDSLAKGLYIGLALLPDNSGFYYSQLTPKGPYVRLHKFGADPSSDATVFGDGYGPEYVIDAYVSEDGRYLMTVAELGAVGQKCDIFVQDLDAHGPLQPIVQGLDAHFTGAIGGDTLFLRTDWNAPNGRVLAVDLKHPARKNWREIVPERSYKLEDISIVGGELALNYLDNVHTRVEVVDAKGKPVRDVPLTGIGTASGLSGRWGSNEVFFTYTSFAQPPVIFRLNLEAGQTERWYETKAPFDPGAIQVEQVWYESKDKTRIPMFLVHKRGLARDGKRPVFLTGYGGFNIAQTPRFSATAVLWSEFDGVFALPGLRGGSEFGEKWHRAGEFESKQNVFNDFIAAAEWLIADQYTNPSKLAIQGGSNGGLLVGAAFTQRPDLFQAVVCGAPLLDMVRYQKFKIAKLWISEYGSADDPEQFKYIYKYSPYHNVKKGAKYPAIMFVTGDADTRVDPLHARKMTALVQASTASDRPVLLHYDTKAGHSAGLPVDRQIENTADELAFLAWQLGIQPVR
jgi:prolyl oligopeptidase